MSKPKAQFVLFPIPATFIAHLIPPCHHQDRAKECAFPTALFSGKAPSLHTPTPNCGNGSMYHHRHRLDPWQYPPTTIPSKLKLDLSPARPSHHHHLLLLHLWSQDDRTNNDLQPQSSTSKAVGVESGSSKACPSRSAL